MNHANHDGRLPEAGIKLHEELMMWETPKGHAYLHLPTRTWMKGLTTILGNLPMEESLLRWIANQGGFEQYEHALEEAKRRGTAVHHGIEELLKGGTLNLKDFDMDAADCLEAFENFWIDYHPHTLAVEQPVWDIRRKIATKLDWRGMIRPPDKRGKRPGQPTHTILDWKTGSGIWESAHYQVHEGAWMYNESNDEPIAQVGIVRLGSKHKRKYEYVATDLTLSRKQHEYRHKIIGCLLWIEHARNPSWEPTFPRKRRESISLPRTPMGQPVFDEP